MTACTNELVLKLSNGKHEVSFEDRVSDPKRVEERIQNGFVFVKFIQTRGGTELGINIIREESDFSKANFENGTGNIHIVGTCELNYCKVKCIADVDLKTRKGDGCLVLM
jgi:hypothetical protein